MPDHQFLFALKVSDHPRFDTMLDDLAECVLKQLRYTPPAIADILAGLREAIAQGGIGAGLEREVRFQAASGQLHIVVSSEGGREWRASRALPD